MRPPASTLPRWTSSSAATELDVKLVEPVTEFSVMRPWSLHARMQGLLQNWAARLAAWLPGGNWRIGGNYVVDADAKVSAGGAAHCDASAEVTRLVFLDSVGRQYVEPVVRLALGGDYDGTTGEVQLGKLQLASSGLALGAAGRVGDKAAIADRADYKTAIADRANYNDVQLGGQFNYDLGRLSELLRPCLGENVTLVGRGSSTAWYRGPLSLADAAAEASVRWDQANVGGMPLGPGELKATLARGVLQARPWN